MRAGDFYRPRAKIGIGIFVGDDRDQTALGLRPDGDFAHFSHDWGVAGIRRVNGDSAVAKHRFGARGGDGNIVAFLFESDDPIRVFFDIGIGFAARERIFEMPHMARGFDVFYFKI